MPLSGDNSHEMIPIRRETRLAKSAKEGKHTYLLPWTILLSEVYAFPGILMVTSRKDLGYRIQSEPISGEDGALQVDFKDEFTKLITINMIPISCLFLISVGMIHVTLIY